MDATTYPLLKVFTPYATLMPYKGYFVGACPLCNAQPAKMVIRPDQGAWHCYSCGVGGDSVDFLQAVEQLSRDQAYLLYKMLIREDLAAPRPAEVASVANLPVAEPSAVPPAGEAVPPEMAVGEALAAPTTEQGSLADLRARLGAVDGFRGVAYFGLNGKALLVENLKAEELVPLNAYFDGVFRAAQGLLGPYPEQSFEGVLHDGASKFMRFDAPVANSRCRIFLALGAAASEARFRMVLRNFLASAKEAPR